MKWGFVSFLPGAAGACTGSGGCTSSDDQPAEKMLNVNMLKCSGNAGWTSLDGQPAENIKCKHVDV